MQELINVAFILIWPIFCLFLFLKMDTVPATFVSIVGGMMILPVKVGFDLPLIPEIDKNVSASLGALLGIVFVKKLSFQWLGLKSARSFVFIILTIPLINLLFNTFPHFTGAVWKPGLTLYEAISAVLQTYLTLLPLIIGMNVIKNGEEVNKILKYLVVATLIYLPLVAFELRFSPQLHNMVFGFHPHEFIQQIRAGGFRAVVFLGHGLLTANFYLGSFIALLILFKSKKFFISKNIHILLICLFFLCLITLKSVTAIVLAIFAIICVLLNHALRIKILKSIVALIAVYPVVVYMGLIPLDWLHQSLQNFVATERLQSLYFRFHNEKLAIDYLQTKIFIGFGGLGRAAVDGVITDGTWLVWTLRFGVVFWIINVFLYSKPLFLSRVSTLLKEKVVLLSVLPAIILIDQVPNSSWSLSYIWFIAGALIGYSEVVKTSCQKT